MTSIIIDKNKWSLAHNETISLYSKGYIISDLPPSINIHELLNETSLFVDNEGVLNHAGLLKIVNSLFGNFCLILKTRKEVILVSDIIRSAPLFYFKQGNNTIITDDVIKYAIENPGFELDPVAVEAFIKSGFVFGNHTVFGKVSALQAGEIITLNQDHVTDVRYFRYIPYQSALNIRDKENIIKGLDNALINVFRRMIAATSGVRNWIVPLSGGHDSRIIVNYLYRLKLKNVVCFSYGTPDNEQSKISKLVTEALGYQWHFVEYTEQKWKKLHDHGLFGEYIEYAFNGVSTPHLQDFLAVYELKKRGVLKDGDVFVPGHALDFLAGSHLTSEDMILTTPEDGLNRVLKKFGTRVNGNNIKTRINEIQIESHIKPEHFQEYFNWQERQAKFIVNSIRVYEFFGFETRLPFWDRKLVDFWLGVPGEMRIGRKAFFEAEQNGILVKELMKIPFAGENIKNKGYSAEKMVKKILPSSLIKLLLKISKRKLKLNEGLNQIYALKAKSVKELLDPIEDFPEQLKPYFKEFLDRYPWQMDYHFLTTLYTVRKQLDKYKNSKNSK